MKKNRCSFLKKSLIGTLVVVTTMAMSSPKGWAMLAPAQVGSEVHEANDARSADVKTIQAALESKILRQRLAEFKLTPEQINSRLSRLSDAQVHQAAMQIRAVNPGGDAGGFVISVLIIGVLVLLFMWLFKRV
jgi:hypothetical protein